MRINLSCSSQWPMANGNSNGHLHSDQTRPLSRKSGHYMSWWQLEMSWVNNPWKNCRCSKFPGVRAGLKLILHFETKNRIHMATLLLFREGWGEQRLTFLPYRHNCLINAYRVWWPESAQKSTQKNRLTQKSTQKSKLTQKSTQKSRFTFLSSQKSTQKINSK